MGTVIFFLIALFIVSIVVVIVSAISDSEKVSNIIKDLDSVELSDPLFDPSQSISSPDKTHRMEIDEENKKVAIWTYGTPSIAKIYTYKDILAVEILEDGVTVNETSRTSQLGGALIGGVLAGGVGAVIGGLSGKSSSSSEITSVDMKIIFNDTKNPYYIINLISKKHDNYDSPIKKGSSVHKSLMEKVHHWHGILGYAIQKSDEHSFNMKETIDLNKIKNTNTQKNSIVTQLKELNELRKDGILTEEEFEQQKIKILNT